MHIIFHMQHKKFCEKKNPGYMTLCPTDMPNLERTDMKKYRSTITTVHFHFKSNLTSRKNSRGWPEGQTRETKIKWTWQVSYGPMTK